MIDLPSWIPNWRLEPSGHPFYKVIQREPGILGGSSPLGTAYSASGKSIETILPYIGREQYLSINGDESAITSFKLDDVAELSSDYTEWDAGICYGRKPFSACFEPPQLILPRHTNGEKLGTPPPRIDSRVRVFTRKALRTPP